MHLDWSAFVNTEKYNQCVILRQLLDQPFNQHVKDKRVEVNVSRNETFRFQK